MDDCTENKEEAKRLNSRYHGLVAKVIAYAALGLTSITGATALPGCGGRGPTPTYLTEEEGDNALDDKLDEYCCNSEILDYEINWTIDLDGFLVDVDARLILNDGTRVAVWYQGENDGEHAAEKAQLEAYGIPWIQINPCQAGELETILDDIKDMYNWAQGIYPQ